MRFYGEAADRQINILKNNFPNAVYYDFLKSDVYDRFGKGPHLFREEVLSLSKDIRTLLSLMKFKRSQRY